ncbi:hypothetical protein THAOC_21031, partial [Thalassiosira oceanica]
VSPEGGPTRHVALPRRSRRPRPSVRGVGRGGTRAVEQDSDGRRRALPEHGPRNTKAEAPERGRGEGGRPGRVRVVGPHGPRPPPRGEGGRRAVRRAPDADGPLVADGFRPNVGDGGYVVDARVVQGDPTRGGRVEDTAGQDERGGGGRAARRGCVLQGAAGGAGERTGRGDRRPRCDSHIA